MESGRQSPRLTEDFPDAQLKEVLSMGWLEDQGSICSFACATDGDDLFIRPDEAGIGSHEGYLAGYLGALPEDPQGLSYDLVHLIGIELAANCPAHSPQRMGGSQYCSPLLQYLIPVLRGQFLNIWAPESCGVGYHYHFVAGECPCCLNSGVSAGGGYYYGLYPQFLGSPLSQPEGLVGVLTAWFGEVDAADLHRIGIGASLVCYNILADKRMKVIFVHGSGAYGGVWRYQTEHLSDSDAINLPGHLDDRTLDSVEEYADWLRQYIAGNGYADVVLAGHSFGGAIALMYALRYPGDLRGVVIIGSGARLKVHHAYITTLERAVKGDLRKWHQLLEEIHRSTPEDYKREVIEKQKAIGPAVMLSDFLCCNKFDLMDRVQEITVPALVICGELDIMTPVKYAHYLGAKLADSRVVIIPQATHFLFAEKPEEVNRAIEDFLNSVSAPRSPGEDKVKLQQARDEITGQ